MSNSFKLCPTHFYRGGENFSRGYRHSCAPLVTGLFQTAKDRMQRNRRAKGCEVNVFMPPYIYAVYLVVFEHR